MAKAKISGVRSVLHPKLQRRWVKICWMILQSIMSAKSVIPRKGGQVHLPKALWIYKLTLSYWFSQSWSCQEETLPKEPFLRDPKAMWNGSLPEWRSPTRKVIWLSWDIKQTNKQKYKTHYVTPRDLPSVKLSSPSFREGGTCRQREETDVDDL